MSLRTAELSFRLLGTGSSGGVPRINGDWGVCDPLNPKNRRTRCSALIEYKELDREEPTRILIDTSPDLREQILKTGVKRLDAVLYTHDHADQCHGIDDLRLLAYAQQKRIPVHMHPEAYETIYSRFKYCFEGGGGYPSILEAQVDLHAGTETRISGVGGNMPLIILDQIHGRIRSLGFRIGNLAYCNDVSDIPRKSLNLLHGLDFFIVDCLKYEPHPTHANLEKVLEWVAELKPHNTILTNLHIDMDYDKLSAELPDGIIPAFDGMIINTKLYAR